MTRIPSRPDPPPRPPKEKKASGLKRSRIKPQSDKRKKAAKEYEAVMEVYKTNNPNCAECGGLASDFHHICRGPDRAATLTNTDLGMHGCRGCHGHWDDKGEYPVERQFAIKFVAALRQYRAITRKNIDVEEVMDYMDLHADW